jgi:hypothetical protein
MGVLPQNNFTKESWGIISASDIALVLVSLFIITFYHITQSDGTDVSLIASSSIE